MTDDSTMQNTSATTTGQDQGSAHGQDTLYDERVLARAVHVDGQWYLPDQPVPAEVAEKITNPKVWKRLGDDPAGRPVPREQAGTSTGARLATRVAVAGRWYGPDDPLPDEVAAQITNPKAWAIPPEPPAAPFARGGLVTGAPATADTPGPVGGTDTVIGRDQAAALAEPALQQMREATAGSGDAGADDSGDGSGDGSDDEADDERDSDGAARAKPGRGRTSQTPGQTRRR